MLGEKGGPCLSGRRSTTPCWLAPFNAGQTKHAFPFSSATLLSSHLRVYFISSDFSGQIIQAISGHIFYFKEKFVKSYISFSLWLIGFD